MEPRFGLRREDEGDLPVLVVEGEVDFGTSPELREMLKPLDGPVVVDLSETTFIDSIGLHVLLVASADVNGHLHIACPPTGPARRLLAAVGIGDLLKVYDSRAAALAAC